MNLSNGPHAQNHILFVFSTITVIMEMSIAQSSLTTEAMYNWTLRTFPNHQTDVDKCGRNCSKSWLCDPDHFLDATEVNNLDSILTAVRSQQECRCLKNYQGTQKYPGINISIAIIYGPEARKHEKEEETPEEFVNRLLDESWSYENCKEDLVVAFYAKSYRIYTAIGDRLRSNVTINCLSAITDRANRSLKKNSTELIHILIAVLEDYRNLLTCNRTQMECYTVESTKPEIKAWVVSLVGLGIILTIPLLHCTLSKTVIGLKRRLSSREDGDKTSTTETTSSGNVMRYTRKETV